MLILIVVTVTTAINGGLFESVKITSKKTERQSVLEELNAITAEFNADVYANPEKYDFDNEDILKTIIEQAKIRICGEENENPNSSITADEETVESSTTTDEEGKISFLIPFTYKGIEAKWKFVINEEIEYIELVFNGIGIQEIGDTPIVEPGGNIKEVTKDGVPIPTGFYYVTGTKNTGVVISDSEADENNPQGNNGSQFVWVPVQTNPKLKIDIDSDKKISKVTIMNLKGDKKEISVNKEYFKETINLTDNTIYEIAIEYADGTKEEKLYVTRLEYVTESKIQDFEFLGIGNGGLEGLADELIKNSEESLDFKIDAFRKIFSEEEIYDTTDETPEKESVSKYGGFYIGRYEVGTDETTKKLNNPKNNISFTEAKAKAETKYNNNSYGVMSTLPSGAAWYKVEIWLINSNTMIWRDVFFDSTGWGNYRKSETEEGVLKKAGSEEQYSKNNIYDLAGNLNEWTTEKDNDNYEIKRGGSYKDYKSESIAFITPRMSSQSVSSDNNSETGYRLMLYIKQ